MRRDELIRAVAEASVGAERLATQLELSLAALDALEPLTPERLAEMSPAEWDSLYAFQMKFLLAQDLASRRLVRGLLALLGEDPRASLRKAVDRAAELGALTSGDDWLELGAVRNMLAHDYPVDLAQFLERIADARERCGLLITNIRLLTGTLRNEGLL